MPQPDRIEGLFKAYNLTVLNNGSLLVDVHLDACLTCQKAREAPQEFRAVFLPRLVDFLTRFTRSLRWVFGLHANVLRNREPEGVSVYILQTCLQNVDVNVFDEDDTGGSDTEKSSDSS